MVEALDLRSGISKFQQLNTTTIPSESVITPQSVLTLVTGLEVIDNIVPPIPGFHMLILIFLAVQPGGFDIISGNGNTRRAISTDQYKPVFLFYQPDTEIYWGGNLDDDN